MLDYKSQEHTSDGIPTSTPLRVEAKKNSAAPVRKKRALMQWFYDLSINQKTQLLPLVTLAVLGGIVGVGAWLNVAGEQRQLLQQSKAELTVTDINYNIKINQMGFGFRGQSDNPAIINAAKSSVTGQLDPALRARVKKILQNETKARSIEYATLVGKDLRVIVNANRDRQGAIFNPNNLVKEVFLYPRQARTSAIISAAELAKEGAPLPPGFSNKDALIRYVITPVTDPATKTIVGALVAGDIVNGKLPIVEATLNAFNGGYSGVYLRKSDQDFTLASSLEKDQGRLKTNVQLPVDSLLKAADKARGLAVTERINFGGDTYTTAARAVLDARGEPVAILVRGAPETELNSLLQNSLFLQLLLSLLGLGLVWLLATLLRRAIAQPVEQLQRTTQAFSQGDRGARAEVFARDEVGQLAVAFNQLADSIENNIEEIRHQEELRRQEQEKVTRQQIENAEQQRLAKEQLQKRALELLMEVDPLSRGDLTIRANVTEDEIGTVADSYNATIRSLRKIVTQVQAAAQQMTATTTNSETSVQELSQEALRQTEEIATALDRLQEMSDSIRAVAMNAAQAEAAVRQATQTVEAGDAAMNRTVDGIMAIQETVTQTSEKVKHLGESSQKISKVVNLIGRFAAQTNLLALKASIEAARAGEEGRGFAVLADEVRALASQSAQATSEIESLVTDIQTETQEVVAAMEAGTLQVAEGTRLVDETKQSLNRITAVSAQISELVQAITESAVAQSEASEEVTETMAGVAAIANQTSTEASQVSASFKELLAVAQELQTSAGQFKVS